MSSKNKIIIIIVAVILVIGISGLIIWLSHRDTDGGEEPTGPVQIIEDDNQSLAEKIVVESYEVNNSSNNRYVKAAIPNIKNLSDKGFQEYLNKKMLKTIQDYQNEITIMIDEDTPAVTLYKYVVSYETYANDRYLSLVISNDYQTGGMRSNAWKDTYNIDVTKGKSREITLADLFESGVDYKEKILEEINSQALAKEIELVGGNGLSTLQDTQKFYIEDGKLVIYFDPAAVAPYANGELKFIMPFAYDNGLFKI